MRKCLSIFLGSGMAVSAAPAFASPDVVASISPIYHIAKSVMDGVGEPSLLIDSAASPHDTTLTPSQVAAMDGADIVFWMAPSIESFMPGTLNALERDDVPLITLESLALLPRREGGVWDSHDHDHGDHGHGDHDDHGHDEHAEDEHDDHGHDEHAEDEHDDHGHDEHAHDDHDDHGHDEHAEEKHDDHDHDEHAHDEHDDHGHDEHAKDEHDDHGHDEHAKDEHDDHGHDEHAKDEHDDHGHDEHAHDEHDDHGHDEHASGEFDPNADAHTWLSTANAVVVANHMAEVLAKADPDHADAYAANADAFAHSMEDLSSALSAQLEPYKGSPYIVFHDAYQYFEAQFGLTGAGSITIEPDIKPGAATLAELREAVVDRGVVCVFAEPQFEPAMVDTIMEGSEAGYGTLDPLGIGAESYADILSNLAGAMADCFKG